MSRNAVRRCLSVGFILACLFPAFSVASQSVEAGVAGVAPRVDVPEPTPDAVRYYQSGHVVWVVSNLIGLAIPALFLWTGWSARLRTISARIGRWRYTSVGVYGALFVAATTLMELPWNFYVVFVRQHAYGLSNQTLGKYASDLTTGTVLGMVVTFLVLGIPYLLLKASPRRWWLYTGLLVLPFSVLVMLIVPIWVEPLFNDFSPLANKQLEERILALAERSGIEGSRVYEVKKSVDTKALNAYVTGIWTTKRIVLWDTLLAELSEEEILAVMGHEMGHYVLGHVVRSIAVATLTAILALWMAHVIVSRLLNRFKKSFGFDSLSDVASLPLLVLILNGVGLIGQPVVLAFSRYQEHEADRFTLELTQDNEAAAQAFVKLQTTNLGYPRPGLFYKLWRSTHPPIGERIDFCNDYRPWESGEPMRYADRFAPVTIPSEAPSTETGGGAGSGL
jgi:Zn-dependent protease with chaperone function